MKSDLNYRGFIFYKTLQEKAQKALVCTSYKICRTAKYLKPVIVGLDPTICTKRVLPT